MTDIIEQLEEIENNADDAHIAHIAGKGAEAITFLRARNKKLIDALQTFANATVIDLTHNGENFVKAIVVSEEDIKSARAILEGATK